MQIIDARTLKPCEIPLTLGERGRGRWAEEVQVARQADRAPTGPDAVGYFTIEVNRPRSGCPDRHVILTRPRPGQTGILLRLDSRGCYTRGAGGSVSLIHGDAEKLTEGRFAYGDAGRICGGPDQLWHVRGPVLFWLVLSGGSSKGYGGRYVAVDRDLRVSIWKPEALVQALGTGDAGSVERLVRDAIAAGAESERLRAAIETLDAVEASDDQAAQVANYFGSDPKYVLKDLRVQAPPSWTPEVGIAEVRSGVLVPGAGAVVALRMGAESGGKRWGWSGPWTRGLEQIAASDDEETQLWRVVEADWAVGWITTKDREEHCVYLADAAGIHSVSADGWLSTRAWFGGTDPEVRPSYETIREGVDALRSGDAR